MGFSCRRDIPGTFYHDMYKHCIYNMEDTQQTSHPLRLFFTLTTVSTMPRARDIIVPDALVGIEEVVIKHTKTKRGTIRTTEKVVPVLHSRKEPSGQSSRLKKRERQPQNVPDEEEGSGGGIPIIDNIQTDLYMGEDDIPEVAEQENPSQATVCV